MLESIHMCGQIVLIKCLLSTVTHNDIVTFNGNTFKNTTNIHSAGTITKV